MRKILWIFGLQLFFILSLQAQPAGYYNSASGLSGSALELALQKIIRNHTKVSYTQLWTSFQTTDKKSNGKVWDMYSDVPGGTPSYEFTFISNQCGTYATEGDCYNREHSFPKSWWGGSSDTMYTDLYQLYPTDGYVNNKRSSYPYGTVGTATWTSTNGSKLGTCNYPGYTGTVFEPIDEYKGDFARSYFYMHTRYLTKFDSWNANTDMLDGSGWSSWAESLLLAWHNADPVSAKEIARNDAVYAIQGNRNPYIDHPEYVAAIYGGADVYPPVDNTNYPAASNETASGFNIDVNLNEAGSSYMVVLSSGASAPTSAQVKAGQDASGSSVAAAMKTTLTISAANTVYSNTFSNLSASTTYDVYVVSEDNQQTPNLQSSPTLVNASTTAAQGGGGGSYFSDLIISEYVEGSSYNKYLEIYNNTGASVNLANYQVQIYFNGGTSAGNTISLSGTLLQGSVYVIQNSSANVWSGTADLSTGSLSFNGNDAVVLVNTIAKGNIDQLGTIGSSTDFAKDKTLTRNITATGPTTTYTASEWDVGAQDYVSGLGNEGALPIRYISFTAKNFENYCKIQWVTSSETNNDYFILEKMMDQGEFTPLSKIQGRGNSNIIQTYTYEDFQSQSNEVYYRLKQYDYDGAYSYSSIIGISKNNEETILQKAIMSENKIAVFFTAESAQSLLLNLYSLDGRCLFNTELNLNSKSQQYQLKIPTLPHGIYILKLQNKSYLVNKKLVY